MAEAMRSRAVIEQAKGILRADHRLTDEEAFEQLTQLSQHANLKLRDVAIRLLEERTKAPRLIEVSVWWSLGIGGGWSSSGRVWVGGGLWRLLSGCRGCGV
jgi:hypothetical protein